MLQGQVHCAACDRDVYPVTQLRIDGGADTGGTGKATPVRSCSECMAILPALASTVPDTTMPKAAPVPMEHPAPIPNRVAARRIQPTATVDLRAAASQSQRLAAVAEPAPPGSTMLRVPRHDYAEMMRDELVALNDAEAEIKARKMYLERMIAMLDSTQEAIVAA